MPKYKSRQCIILDPVPRVSKFPFFIANKCLMTPMW